MKLRASLILIIAAVPSLLLGCGDDAAVTCGDGTMRSGTACVAEDAGPIDHDSGSDSGLPPPDDGLLCGEGTIEVDGECIAEDAGMVVPPPPAAGAIGAACETDDDCESGSTCLVSATLPGGACTVINCDADLPCPVGSTCFAVTLALHICMPYCDTNSECRTDDGYNCQAIFGSGINICAPSCNLSASCPSGTTCNEDNGLCELAECDPSAATSPCSDEQTCWPEDELSSEGGLCLLLCTPDDPAATCKVSEKGEVCQPLAEDPANTGFCAPPVCNTTEECPAGALCDDQVCQPPALCDEDGACDDDETTCVSGKCMPVCPEDPDTCAEIHSGLVCADVLDVPACLPLGTFPGSACRPNRDDACSDLAVEGGSTAMVCENDVCLADCGTGGQTLCTGISDDLICAAGIFEDDLCLPRGTFPGGPCGAGDACAQDLNGNPSVDMTCRSGSCLIDCDEADKWTGYGDSLCELVDPTLTCSDAAGSVCVRGCDVGTCSVGFSCLDSGDVPDHENACLPTGSFPGSPCRATSGDQCDEVAGSDMLCVNDACLVNCDTAGTAAQDDGLCQAVSPVLTCSESAGDVCVRGCVASACDTGYSCLDAGDATHQNACLPTGSFPGSPCAAGNCAQDLGGNAAVDMECVDDTCVVSCGTAGGAGVDDSLCQGVSASLTCSESASDICVYACVAGNCLPDYSCLDATGENACLPTGSFPGSPCRSTSGDECDAVAGSDMLCVNDACLVNCDTLGTATQDDGLCQAVSSVLTCSESASDVCVRACVAGACDAGYSCLDAAGENACLPDGSFPGAACGASDSCAQDLGFPMECQTDTDTCVIDCNTAGPAATDDGLCGAVDSALTCSETAGDICVYECVAGACPGGYSCFDAGGENACLPDGSFPGAACATGDACAQDLGFPMECQLDTDTCAIDCAAGGDTLCGFIDGGLTCSAAAGDICVYACVAGACPTDYSCFDAGGENACLPDGSFPGSACAVGDTCSQDLGFGMLCQSDTCVIDCDTAGPPATDDGLCSAASGGVLTCSETASDICVVACVAGACPPGFGCFDVGNENACLPM